MGRPLHRRIRSHYRQTHHQKCPRQTPSEVKIKLAKDLYAKPNIRLATADHYQLMIETYTIPRIGIIKLTKLTSRDLQKLYKDLMEHGSVHRMLHCAFGKAVKERLISRNPTDECIAPKIQKFERKTLHPEDMKAYLDTANARGLLYLAVVSGLRKDELVALLWSDPDIENRTIFVSK